MRYPLIINNFLYPIDKSISTKEQSCLHKNTKNSKLDNKTQEEPINKVDDYQSESTEYYQNKFIEFYNQCLEGKISNSLPDNQCINDIDYSEDFEYLDEDL